jgi:hypothetical protein
MDKILFQIGSRLDEVRGLALRFALSNALLRKIFLSRALRLGALFLAAMTIALTTSVLAPLWVLILGPVIYGTPHLLSSLRYVHRSLEDSKAKRQNTLVFFSSVFACVSLLRIFSDFNLLPYQSLSSSQNTVEIVSYVISLFLCTLYFGRSAAHVICAVLLGAVFVWAAWRLPLWMTGLLVLSHNFIAFIYWISATKTRPERAVAVGALLLFAFVNYLIFRGSFDFVYRVFQPAAEISWAELDYSQIGKMILPWSSSYVLWFHAVVAYAFGQSLHYFIWMKAIPDQQHTRQVPTSFKQSLSLLKRDFSGRHFLFLISLVVGSLVVWTFFRVPEARIVYFALAAYHGYLEIAGLAFLKFQDMK